MISESLVIDYKCDKINILTKPLLPIPCNATWQELPDILVPTKAHPHAYSHLQPTPNPTVTPTPCVLKKLD